MSSLSAFLIVRDGVRLGYPFLEACRAVLPSCDELLVSDGGSADGTWEALLALHEEYPGQVRLFRDRWPGGGRRGAVLAAVTNALRWRCHGEYCLNVQANEILPEESAALVARLPALYPEVELFRLPFLTLLGSRVAWTADFRARLFRNLPAIVSRGDAYDVGYDLRRALRAPRQLADRLRGRRTLTAWLPQPFHRYRALFPDCYLAKLELLAPGSARWQRELAFARAVRAEIGPERGHADAFWERMRAYFDEARWRADGEAGPWPPVPLGCLGEVSTAPSIARPLFGAWSYDVAASLRRLREERVRGPTTSGVSG